MDSRELYSMLLADHFDLLGEDEIARLAQVVREQPERDPERFVQEVLTAISGPVDPRRELAFRAGLEAAEDRLAGDRAASTASPRWQRLRQVWRLAVAAALGASLATVWLNRAPEPDPLPSGTSQAFLLTAERSDDGLTLDLDASSAPDVSLVFEARLEVSEVRWELVDGNLQHIASGAITLRGERTLRTLSVHVSKDALRPGSHYWLELTDEAGTSLRRWRFKTE